MDQQIRVLLADDHPLLREGLVTVINSEHDMNVAGEASSGAEALKAFRELRPDVTLLDLRLPDMDGVEVTKAIRKDFPNARIVILTTYLTDEYIHQALKAGAQGYLLKTVPKAEFLATIRAVHSGYRRMSPEVANRLAGGIQHVSLTPRELEVLRLIVRGSSNKEIGSELKITESTVKYHINMILSKLGVSDRTQAATAALQRGLVPMD